MIGITIRTQDMDTGRHMFVVVVVLGSILLSTKNAKNVSELYCPRD